MADYLRCRRPIGNPGRARFKGLLLAQLGNGCHLRYGSKQGEDTPVTACCIKSLRSESVIPVEVANTAPPAAAGHWHLLRWFLVAILLAVIALAIVVEVAMHRAMPILKGRIVETLSARFNSKVE